MITRISNSIIRPEGRTSFNAQHGVRRGCTTPADGSSSFASPDATSSKLRRLEADGAFDFPTKDQCFPLLQAYFNWFHPCFPVLDRVDVASRFQDETLPPLLLQAILFIGAIYCSDDALRQLGLGDRLSAKAQFYNRGKLIFEAEWETDKAILLSSVFLLSFWRGCATEFKDVRYWLAIAITLAQSCGLHRRCVHGPALRFDPN